MSFFITNKKTKSKFKNLKYKFSILDRESQSLLNGITIYIKWSSYLLYEVKTSPLVSNTFSNLIKLDLKI